MIDNEELIKLTQKLVSIESSNIGTFEKEIGDFVYDWMSSETDTEVVKDEFEKDRFNVVSMLKSESDEPPLLIIAHMDTVPIGDGWEHDPFGEMDGDRFYGRGAYDMKCGLATAMLAYRDIANEVIRDGAELKRTLIFAATADEEDRMLGAERLIESGYATAETLAVDFDCSDETIYMGHKGKCWYEITAKGKSAHSAFPETGIDAIAAMAEVIRYIRKALPEFPSDDLFGMNTVCFGTIEGGDNTNIVAGLCKMKIDVRINRYLSEDGCDEVIDRAIETAKTEVPGIEITYKKFASRPATGLNENSPIVIALQQAILEETGEKKQPVVEMAYTDSGVIAAMTGNRNCITFGPYGEALHKPNEWVSISSMKKTAKIIDRFIRLLVC